MWIALEREDLAGIETFPPGSLLSQVIDDCDPQGLDDFELIEFMREARKVESWAASRVLDAIAELNCRRKSGMKTDGVWDSHIGEFVVTEVEAALTLTGHGAAQQTALAAHLAADLHATFDALRDGSIDSHKARIISDALMPLTREHASLVEAEILPLAPGLTTGELRVAVKAAIQQVDPAAFAEQQQTAVNHRRVEKWDNTFGTSDLAGRDLPAETADRIMNRVTAIATALKTDGDTRPIDMIRADVYSALLLGQSPAPNFPGEPPAPSADDCSDGETPDSETPGGKTPGGETPGSETPGGETPDGTGSAGSVEAAGVRDRIERELTLRLLEHDHIPPGSNTHRRLIIALAQELAAREGTATRSGCTTHTTPSGQLAHGAATYRPPAKMRALINERDRCCRFPGCRTPAARCDGDHTIPHHRGGPTCPCNLALLCRHHHRTKARNNWRVLHLWPGVLLWITPSGHWHLTGPPPFP